MFWTLWTLLYKDNNKIFIFLCLVLPPFSLSLFLSLTQIPFSDPRRGVQRCMPFFRSAPSCVDASVVCRHREQLNAITAFVDANMVYGSSDALAQSLRNLSSPLGLLTHNHLHSDQGLAYLPYLPRKQLDPCAPRQGSNTGKNTTSMGNLTFCYLAGKS